MNNRKIEIVKFNHLSETFEKNVFDLHELDITNEDAEELFNDASESGWTNYAKHLNPNDATPETYTVSIVLLQYNNRAVVLLESFEMTEDEMNNFIEGFTISINFDTNG